MNAAAAARRRPFAGRIAVRRNEIRGRLYLRRHWPSLSLSLVLAARRFSAASFLLLLSSRLARDGREMSFIRRAIGDYRFTAGSSPLPSACPPPLFFCCCPFRLYAPLPSVLTLAETRRMPAAFRERASRQRCARIARDDLDGSPLFT